MRECIDAVERAFRALAAGEVLAPRITGTPLPDGGFHVKTCGVLSPPLYAAKINANFPRNPTRYGLPTVQGVVALFDAERGKLLALLDSGEITRLRTAAASAVAARHLAREDAHALCICGCGVQGRAHLEALSLVRQVDVAFAHDIDPDVARTFAAEMSTSLGIDVRPADALAEAAGASDMIAMCTTSREVVLRRADVRDGAFIAAIGADSEDKRELDTELLAASAVVVDDLAQCAAMGELRHAVEEGVMDRAGVRADLAAVVAGKVAGRRTDDEITIFDSTGIALEDVAASAVVFERAVAAGTCDVVDLGG